MKKQSLEEIARDLRNTPLGPVLAVTENWDDGFALNRHRSITRTLDWSWALLTESEKRVFAAASLFPGALDREVLGKITGEDEETLYNLVDASLVRTNEHNTVYTLHHLTRAYARLCLIGGEVWRDAQERATVRPAYEDNIAIRTAFVDHYHEQVKNWQDDTAQTVVKFRYNLSDNQVYIREKENVTAAAYEAVALKYTDAYIPLNRFGYPLTQLGYWNEAENYFALFQRAFTEANDTGNASWAMTELAQIYANKGDWDGAIKVYEQSIEIERAIGNRQGEAATLHGLGNIYAKKGDWDGAIRVYEQSLEIKRAIGDRQGAAVTTASLGNIYRASGNIKKAIEAYRDGRDQLIQLGDVYTAGIASDLLASALAGEGRIAEAIEVARVTVNLFSRTQDRQRLTQTQDFLRQLEQQQR